MLRKVNLILLAAIVSACVFEAEARASVSLEVEADTPVVRLEERQRVVVRALVRPSAERRRVPLAVALVLDKSGSMSSDGKMENAKRGALEALEMLDARDVAAVVVYDTEASVAVPARSASDKNTFSRAVSRIQPGGSTALYDGVRVGANQLWPFAEEGYVPRVILLSDGLANAGPSSPRELASFGRALAERGATITTIGLGLDYNEDLMTALAAESGGNAYFARHAKALPEIFARDMEDAVTLTARKVRVTLNCGDGVSPVRAIGRPALRKEDETASGSPSIEVAIDNLYGAEKYALFEIEISGANAKAPGPAATVKLEYLDPVTGDTVAQEAPLRLAFAKDENEVEKNRRADITAQTEIARSAETREEAMRLADEGRADEAARVLDRKSVV
ncbi:MAG: VWA domain-containing protein [Synergistaceae bacterium]|jgi:Ca-activated chloride channel family protein|nr:VWA domain-containing protein [Synergistaceae bacterium]